MKKKNRRSPSSQMSRAILWLFGVGSFAFVLAFAWLLGSPQAPFPLSGSSGVDVDVVAKELPGERTLTSKTFDVGEGVRESRFFTKPIHYPGPSGELEDIDSQIEPSLRDGYVHQVVKGIYKVYYKDLFTEDALVSLLLNDQEVTIASNDLSLLNEEGEVIGSVSAPQPVQGVVDRNHITYEGAYGEGVDVRMTYLNQGLYREILIDSFDALGIDENSQAAYADLGFHFNVSLPEGVEITIGEDVWDERTLVSDERITFTDKDGELLFFFDPPFATESGIGAIPEPLSFWLHKNAAGVIEVRKLIPVSWLKDAVGPIRADDSLNSYASTDGSVASVGAGYSSQQSASSGTTLYGTSNNAQMGQWRNGSQYSIWRAFFSFDTSAIPDANTVSAATLHLHGYTAFNRGTWDIRVYPWTGGPTLTTADYSAWTTSQQGTMANSSWSESAYNVITVTAGNVSKTGTTDYVVRSSEDVNVTAPDNSNYIKIRYNEYTGTSSDPYLSVTHSSPNTDPTAATVLYVNTTANGAQSGSSNPTITTDQTPEFSAIFNDPDSGDIANQYDLQVSTQSNFSSQVWNVQQSPITNITEGNRSIDIEYGDADNDGTQDGTATLLTNGTYYWRIRFYDDSATVGPWTTGGERFTLSLPDTDGDGLLDVADNCPAVANAGQEDTDGIALNNFVGYWRFDEGSGTTAADASTQNNDGTLTNSPSWTSSGLSDDAITFDGTDDHVVVADDASLDLTSAITLAAWVKTSAEDFVIVKDPNATEYSTKAKGTYSSSGSTTNIYSGWYSSQRMYALFDFDVSSLSGATINSATLKVTRKGGSGSTPDLKAYRITESWTESTARNSAAAPSYSSGSGSASFSPSSNATTYSIDVTDIVQDWADGTYTPYGFSITKATSGSSNSYVYFYDDTYSTVSYRPVLEVDYSTTKINVPYSLSTVSGGQFLIKSSGTDYTVTCSSSVNDGNWHHLAATYDGSSMKIYKDGVLCGTNNTVPGSMPTNNDPVWIGRHWDPSDSTGYFNGDIDEAAILNTALSASNIQLMYNNGNHSDPQGYLADGVGDVCDVCPLIADPLQNAGSCVTNAAPTASSISPSQTDANTVNFRSTIADTDNDATTAYVQHSMDGGTTWTPSVFTATASTGTISVSTGTISGVDTDSSSVQLTIDWNVGLDLPSIETSTARIRIFANDGTATGTAAESAVTFDTAAPLAPGALTNVSASATAATLGFGSAASDTNFSFYKIFYTLYSAASGPTESPDGDLNNTNSVNALDVSCSALVAAWDAAGRDAGSIPVCISAVSVQAAIDLADFDCSGVVDDTDTTHVATRSLGNNLAANIDANSDNIHDDCQVPATTVSTSDTEINSTSVSALSDISYNAAASFVLSGIATGTGYAANIWAYDTYSRSTAATQLVFYTLTDPGSLTVTASSGDSNVLRFVVDRGANPNDDTVTYAICRSTDNTTCANYMQADGTMGVTAVWQTLAQWGASGFNSTGWSTSANTRYTFFVQSKNQDGVTSSLAPAVRAYSGAGAPTGVTVTNGTTESQLGNNVAFTASNASGLKIERDDGCDGSYDRTVYNNASTVPASPYLDRALLTAFTCVQYRVIAINGDGVENTGGAAVPSQYTTPPAAPTVNIGSTTVESITWTWAAVSGADSYRIYSTQGAGLLGTSNGTSFQQSTLTPGTQYGVTVRAVKSGVSGEGVASSPVMGYTSPDTPQSLVPSTIGPNGFTLGWNKSGGGSVQAQIFGQSGTNSGNLGQNQHAFSSLQPNESYTVEVINIGADGSTSTAQVQVTTAYEPPSGINPASVSATGISLQALGTFPNLGSGQSKLKFKNVTDNVTTNVTDTSWVADDLEPDSAYTFTVTAVNSAGLETDPVTHTVRTYAQVPSPPAFSAVSTGTVSLSMNFGNPTTTEHYIYDSVAQKYADATGAFVSDAPVWRTRADWGDTFQASGVSEDAQVCIQIAARNADGVITDPGTAACDWTAVGSEKRLIDTSVATAVTVTDDSPTIVFDENNNRDTGNLSTVNIPTDIATTKQVALRMHRIKQNGVVSTSAQSIEISRAIDDDDEIDFVIPGTTQISCEDTSWEEFIVPTVRDSSSVTLPETSGFTKAISQFVEIGVPGTNCDFSKPVKLVLPDQAGNTAFYVDASDVTHIITDTCDAADNPTLDADSECSIDSGTDLIIFTRHATEYGSYSVSQATAAQSSSSSGGGGGGGGGSLPETPISLPSVLINSEIAPVTFSRTVVIEAIDAPEDVTEMAIALDSGFSTASWQPYTDSAAFILPDVIGPHTVYVKVRNNAGTQSNVVSRTVYLQEVGSLEPPTVSTPGLGDEITTLPFTVNGSAFPGANVSVRLAGSIYMVEAGDSGNYEVTILDALVPGEYTVYVSQDHEGEESAEVSVPFSYVGGGEIAEEVAEDEPLDAEVEDGELEDLAAETEEPALGGEDAAPIASDPLEASAAQDPAGPTQLPNTISTPSLQSDPVEDVLIEDVEDIVSDTIQRSSFMLVLQSETAQFHKQQLDVIETLPGKSVDILVRPPVDVHSITARLYPEETDLSADDSGDSALSLRQFLFGDPVHAQSVTAEWIKGYVFERNFVHGNIFNGDINLGDVPSGDYRLVITFNERQGERIHVAKEIHVVENGTVKNQHNAFVSKARLALHRKQMDGSFMQWEGDGYGQENPVFTNVHGTYAFQAPAGQYKLTVEARGHKGFESGVITLHESGVINRPVLLQKEKQNLWQKFWGWLRGLLTEA